MPRWLRITLLAIASIFVLYLVAANVILRTHLLRGWIGKDESKLKVEYSSAWSLYPGHVAVRDLSIRFQDKSVQMLIGIERGTLRIDPFAAAKRTFRVSKLTAEGATFRLRQKVETLEGNEGRVRAFPPIEGFPDPPVEKKVPEPPIPDDQYKMWTIDLPDISASMREVWVMEFRYRGGEGTLTGGFHMRPKREMWVPPSTMLTHGGTVSLGDRDLIRGGDARLDAQFSAFDLRDPKGVEILRYLTASVHQRGELVLPSIGATYFPADSHVELANGAGPVAIDIAIERGVIQPSTHVTFHTDEVTVTAPSIAVKTDLDLVGRMEPAGAASTVVVETTAAHATGTPALDVRDLRTLIDLGNDDLASAFSLERVTASVASAHTGDLHAWNAFAPPNSTYDGGALTVAARAELHHGALHGRVDVALEKAKMTIGPFVFLTTGKVWTNVASDDVEKAVAFPGAGTDLHDTSLRLLGGHAEGLWMRSRFEKALLTTSGAVGFDSDIAVDSGPGDRTLELFTRLAHLPDVAADAASGSQLAALTHLRVRPGLIAFAVTQAKNGALESRGRIQKRTGAPVSGAFLVSLGPLHSGIDLSGGGVSVVPLAGGAWLEEKLQKR